MNEWNSLPVDIVATSTYGYKTGLDRCMGGQSNQLLLAVVTKWNLCCPRQLYIPVLGDNTKERPCLLCPVGLPRQLVDHCVIQQGCYYVSNQGTSQISSNDSIVNYSEEIT